MELTFDAKAFIKEQKVINKVLPAQAFKKQIEVDYQFIAGLQNLIDLQEKYGQEILLSYPKGTASMPIKKQLELAQLEVDCNYNKEKLLVQKEALRDKLLHYETYFLPAYQQRIDEVAASWDEMYETALKLQNTETPAGRRLHSLLNDFEEQTKEQKANIEIRAIFWPDLKNLLSKLQ